MQGRLQTTRKLMVRVEMPGCALPSTDSFGRRTAAELLLAKSPHLLGEEMAVWLNYLF